MITFFIHPLSVEKHACIVGVWEDSGTMGVIIWGGAGELRVLKIKTPAWAVFEEKRPFFIYT